MTTFKSISYGIEISLYFQRKDSACQQFNQPEIVHLVVKELPLLLESEASQR
ncbi:MAG: hypothetical protein ACTS7E_02240 [Arsenophonus sp. NC-CH8-MAG3]